MNKEKICAVCHKKYSYCPACDKDKNKPTWMFTFCSQNCHDIYNITSSYANKELKVEEAKNKLDKLNLSQLDNFGESYQTVIADIKSLTIPKIEKVSVEKSIKNENDDKIKSTSKKK